ncbi:uricase [Wallemia mellicola]|uniref:Uricase n=2 Tax=Wallemia mellicola TaxID=1708541 RepID=A0A4T0P3S2_9BASI|nr:uricase [Wallemia mellicola CBS 633.66]TIB78734.1 hypothetical protein E3Q23_00644 [Wallemia mellicola]EIM23579.1 uricase [Wallemia mellicola CBS 633.66]TIB81480.1 uricase [Wallemia mellicola]TIC01202.1 uricase [Wallemia mellicola]TIC04766.1 uricase [Wallemia mellicola]|eukprot:XP_006956253.1 uricase [Wallemia mellicola CBS 633.66]
MTLKLQKSTLTTAKYGKDGVKILRIVRNDQWHEIAEYTITVLLEGDISASYTEADNSVIVTTDSIKNTINVFAQNSQHVLQPETFALELGLHFVTKYSHIKKAHVDLLKHRWTRICPTSENGQPHGHSFRRDGDDKRVVNAIVDASGGVDNITIDLKAGLKDVFLLKSTGSSFNNFINDEFTTLRETDDRVFSTIVDCSYSLVIPQANSRCFTIADVAKTPLDDIAESVRNVTLDTFAVDFSESVQTTLYTMAERIIEQNDLVKDVSYKLPNKHYIPIDLTFYQEKGATNDVLLPTEFPSGLITATVSRV